MSSSFIILFTLFFFLFFFFFFCNDTATTEIYTLSLHDALPIWNPEQSNPPGEAPPHTYGVPRYCMAIPTTPPYCDGGAAAGATVSVGVTPTPTLNAVTSGGARAA